MWQYRGERRPDFAEPAGAGQESVWDYPRPPDVVPDERRVEILHDGRVIARSTRSVRVRETASPPTFYLPPQDVRRERLAPAGGSSFCEWKGAARYFVLATDPGGPPVAWCYPSPSPSYAAIGGWLSFYPERIECRVDGERVRPQGGGFYGGWVTDEIVGPWKGGSGTGGW
jgi:uncharacterized protein (DUF427 family)